MMRSSLIIILLTTTFMANSQNPTRLTSAPTEIRQTAGRTQLGEFAPKFAELNDDILFAHRKKELKVILKHQI